jgi:hypothetical protein
MKNGALGPVLIDDLVESLSIEEMATYDSKGPNFELKAGAEITAISS